MAFTWTKDDNRHSLTNAAGDVVAYYEEEATAPHNFSAHLRVATRDHHRDVDLGASVASFTHEKMRNMLVSLAEEYAEHMASLSAATLELERLTKALAEKWPHHCPDCGGTGGRASFNWGSWHEPPCYDFDECSGCTCMGIDPLDTTKQLGEDGMTVSGVSIDQEEAPYKPLDPLLEEIEHADAKLCLVGENLSYFNMKLYEMECYPHSPEDMR